MNFKILAISGVMAAALATGAQAATFTETQTQDFTQDGQDLTFSFTGLAASAGTGGSILIEGGGDPNNFPGLDFFDADEIVDIGIDGALQGTFNCTGNGGATVFDTVVQFNNFVDCSFAQTFALSGSALDGFLSDGAIEVLFSTSDNVTAFSNESDFVRVTLSYDTAVAAVPLPATGLLLLGALGAFGLRRRRTT